MFLQAAGCVMSLSLQVAVPTHSTSLSQLPGAHPSRQPHHEAVVHRGDVLHPGLSPCVCVSPVCHIEVLLQCYSTYFPCHSSVINIRMDHCI